MAGTKVTIIRQTERRPRNGTTPLETSMRLFVDKPHCLKEIQAEGRGQETELHDRHHYYAVVNTVNSE